MQTRSLTKAPADEGTGDVQVGVEIEVAAIRGQSSRQLIQMHRRRKRKYQISCGDENGTPSGSGVWGVPALHGF
jgi:hypothetical protein